MPADASRPRVSVLMPTYRHGWVVRRALASLRAQTLQDWELIVVDDGSPDDTRQVFADESRDGRISYHRLDENRGLGHALNVATDLARGDYLAYLPSDDVYFPDHLALLSDSLDQHPQACLAYGGAQTHRHWAGSRGLTLLGDEPLTAAGAPGWPANPLALVQVMHRRLPGSVGRWPTRSEIESDTLEMDRWSRLLAEGATFVCCGRVTCEWTDHPDQRHKIIGETHEQRTDRVPGAPTSGRGLAAYREFYGVGRQTVNWQPRRGPRMDESARYADVTDDPGAPAPDGLRILLVGELGFHPDRIRALADDGHELHGLWTPAPETWDATGRLPVGWVRHVPYDRHWRQRVRELRPDAIYALLNTAAVPLVDEVVRADLGIPLFFHFKESAFHCLRLGIWDRLVRILEACDGQIFISQENLEWFASYVPHAVGRKPVLLLDGDLPRRAWMTREWAARPAEWGSEPHTVCAGRPTGVAELEDVLRAGIHLHLYGSHFHTWYEDLVRRHHGSGMLHLHDTVEPQQWVRELSRYDAAWLHGHEPANHGDIRAASWSDLNLPARLGTYAVAGLPWIFRDGGLARTSIRSLAERLDVGIPFRTAADLADRLRDESGLRQLTTNMRVRREQLAFDTQVPDLVRFFRGAPTAAAPDVAPRQPELTTGGHR
ncbi:glycosyltransferase family 2 protein [Micromonospora sp. NPDC051141]|uniref:glycosyltransferase family 2 protein n=1 Tax=Micromonospora sp. NPDC051141 TaxID=3364284 RepID=UPI0037935A88